MSDRLSCRPGDAALWSKVSPCRRSSLTRQPRRSWKINCEKPLRWSPVEDTKQKAVQIEQAVEHRMPDTHNLYVLESQIKAIRHLNAESSVVMSACSRILYSIRHIQAKSGSVSETAKALVHSRFSTVTKQHSDEWPLHRSAGAQGRYIQGATICVVYLLHASLFVCTGLLGCHAWRIWRWEPCWQSRYRKQSSKRPPSTKRRSKRRRKTFDTKW